MTGYHHGNTLRYGNLGNTQQAIKDYSKSIELNPQDAKAYACRGIAYPDATAHKEKHQSMTSKVFELHTQFEQGKTMMSIEVMEFLQQWLDKHILGTDKQYVPFLTSKGVH
jgi:hemerythrin